MAHRGHRVNQEKFCCSICLDLLKDPVTTSCGHSYCRSCINNHWDTQDERRIYSCPQCRQTFRRRPNLKKNTMLADLVEELKKTGLQAAPADYCYAGAEDVACDVCTGRKLKAIKSCLQCVASYCEEHLQPHFDSPALQKHKLVEPSKRLQGNICSRHNKVMKMFCRTDQQSICHICVMGQHKGHDTVTAAAERTERQRELQVSRQNIQQRIQHRERDVKLLQQEVEAINSSADKAVEKSEKIFTELIRVLDQRRSDVKQQLRSQQEAEVSRVRELQEKLVQEITELKMKDKELEKLSYTQDHNQFLQDYPSVSQLREPAASASINTRPLRYFEDMTAAVTALQDQLQDILSEKWTNLSHMETEVDLCGPTQPQPETRAQFLNYARDITMDLNTANEYLQLSDGNRKVTLMEEQQSYDFSSERFIYCWQVMSRETLTGRCYWEVEPRGDEIQLAVAYRNISRDGRFRKSGFGKNDKSWALEVDESSYNFWHNGVETPVSGPRSSRIGVFLDHSAGVLSFYCVSRKKNMTLLHRVQTTFTQPLHAGLLMHYDETTAEFIRLQ